MTKRMKEVLEALRKGTATSIGQGEVIYPMFREEASDCWSCECGCPHFRLSRDKWIRCNECDRKVARWYFPSDRPALEPTGYVAIARSVLRDAKHHPQYASTDKLSKNVIEHAERLLGRELDRECGKGGS